MTQLSMYNILERKKTAQELTQEEIKWVINGLMDGTVQDYQMSALLMAIAIQGMSTAETAHLTDAMLYSGKSFQFQDKAVVDKHSTGGIGDKTSFILAPIAAACGVKVPMIAGRGLGHTGGTVDKVEAIPGFNVNLGLEAFEKLLMEKGIVMIGQTDDIAPADKKIYALRDVTATIDNIPLITASIMSKKLAEGANGIVLDIKVGSGAFMRTKDQARKLANSILNTATRFDRKCVTLLTNMDQPLGNAVGHTLEIIESIEVLKGEGPKDLSEVSLELAAHMIHIGQKATTYDQALQMARATIENGMALAKFKELLENQNGNSDVITDYSLMELAQEKTQVSALEDGFIASFQTDTIGFLCTELGGGRKIKTDKIDMGVGFYFHKKIGSQVKTGEPIVTIYHHPNQKSIVSKIAQQFLNEVIVISSNNIKTPETIYEVLSN